MHYTLATFTSLLLLTISSTVNAADCFGDQGTHPNAAATWLVRESMCGPRNLCSKQSGTCYISIPVGDGHGLTFSHSGSLEHCWDATENIINQCFYAGGNYDGSQRQKSGTWQLNGETYKIEIKEDDRFFWGGEGAKGMVGVHGVDDDPSTPGGDYVWGPQKFCIGLGPGSGGNDACVDIWDSNCYVISPIDNTVPKVKCLRT